MKTSPGPRIDAVFLISAFLLAAPVENTWPQMPPTAALPEIHIVSPSDGATFIAPADILVTVAGSDVPNTGHIIKLFQGTTLISLVVLDPISPTATSPVPFKFDFPWNSVPAGHYTLTATIDTIASDPVHIVVRHGRPNHHHR